MKPKDDDNFIVKFVVGFLLGIVVIPLVCLVVNRPRKVETSGNWQQYARDHETDPHKRMLNSIEDYNKDANPFKK